MCPDHSPRASRLDRGPRQQVQARLGCGGVRSHAAGRIRGWSGLGLDIGLTRKLLPLAERPPHTAAAAGRPRRHLHFGLPALAICCLLPAQLSTRIRIDSHNYASPFFKLVQRGHQCRPALAAPAAPHAHAGAAMMACDSCHAANTLPTGFLGLTHCCHRCAAGKTRPVLDQLLSGACGGSGGGSGGARRRWRHLRQIEGSLGLGRGTN